MTTSTPLPRRFYDRSPLRVARELIGCTIVRRLPDELLTGKIVETEAYGAALDPASHAYKGKTPRNEVMFGAPGRAYVYFTYGAHHCLNVVTGRPKGEGAGAVLIRSIEPTSGLETMMKLRHNRELHNLASGPGKICQAFAINLTMNGVDVSAEDSLLFVLPREEPSDSFRIVASPRIGISVAVERPWRFFLFGNKCVSRGGKLIYPAGKIAASRP